MAKTEVLFVRVTPEDHATIVAHAKAAHLGVAEYMRRKAAKQAGRCVMWTSAARRAR